MIRIARGLWRGLINQDEDDCTRDRRDAYVPPSKFN